MLKPDIEVVVSKDPLPTSLLLPTAKGHPPTVRAVPGLSACGGLGGKHHVNKFEPINWFRNKER